MTDKKAKPQRDLAYTQAKDRRLIIGIIIVGAFISSLNQTVMTASLPKIMTEFGITAGVGQWLTNAYLLFMGVMIPCTGYLMERFSAKRLYLVSVFLFFAGCAAAAFSMNIRILLLARVVQALGAGILLPLPQVVAFRLYEPEKRGMVMGIVGLTTGFAPAFGPTFAGWMVDSFGWRSIFYVTGALSVLGILLAVFWLPAEKMEAKGKLDIPSVALSTLGFCGLLTGVTNQGNYGIRAAATFVPLLLGIFCVACFAVRQLKLPAPFLELRVFLSPNFTFGTLLLVFAYGSMLSVSMLMPVYIQNLRGYSATVSGLVMLPGALSLAFLNPVTGRILDRKGPYLLSLAGLVCLGSATFGLSCVGEHTPLFVITLIYGIRMLGIVALLQPLQTWAVNSLKDEYVAHGTALMNTVRQIGGAIVSAMLVTVMSSAAKTVGDMKGIRSSFLVTAVLVFVCLAVAAFFMGGKENRKAQGTEPEPMRVQTAKVPGNLRLPMPEGGEAFGKTGNGYRILTIEREFGSGGHEIGEKVAQALKIPFYDRELIALEAREAGFSHEYVEKSDEATPVSSRALDWAARSYGAFETRLFEAGELTVADQLYQAQRRVIQRIAQDGPAVIIGRCADDILRETPGCLSLFVCADTESKKERLEKDYGIRREKADGEMKRKDSERAFYYKRYTGKSWGDSANYHMVINSAMLGIGQSARLITEAMRSREKTAQKAGNII